MCIAVVRDVLARGDRVFLDRVRNADARALLRSVAGCRSRAIEILCRVNEVTQTVASLRSHLGRFQLLKSFVRELLRRLTAEDLRTDGLHDVLRHHSGYETH